MHVAVAQIESVLGDLDANLKKHLDVIDAARSAGVDFLLFPELSLTGHSGGRDAARLALDRDHVHVVAMARAAGSMLTMFGLIERARDVGFYNSVFAVRHNAVVHVHHKINLATYGRLDDGAHFIAGDRVDAFETADTSGRVDQAVKKQSGPGTNYLAGRWRLAPMICADTWNPPLVHLAATQGATLMAVAVSSALEAVGGGFDNPSAWDVNLRFHALTYGMPVMMANRVGVESHAKGALTFWGGSRIVDPFGHTIAAAEGRDEALVRATLDFADVKRARALLPTIRDGNLPLLQREFDRARDERSN